MIKKYEVVLLLGLFMLGVLIKGAVGFLFLGMIYFAYLLYKGVRHKSKKSRKWQVIRYGLEMSYGLFILLFITVEGVLIHDMMTHKNYSPQAEYVIILGAGLAGDTPRPSLKYRLDRAVEYHQKYPLTTFILSGGKGSDEWISEAEAMRRYLVANAVPHQLLHLEDHSTSTEENLRFSLQYFNDNGIKPTTKVGVISNSFHLYRVGVIAQSLGIAIEPIHADSVWYLLPRDIAREFFALGNEYRKILIN